ncbi:UTRA domain-containing protein [Streptomyces sp. NPDC001502]|uniref:UTRA domain-containing protein n=1 Tax=Streptomyces sp. NPDC001502 TaxID=3364578 RepID=UPI0036B905B4
MLVPAEPRGPRRHRQQGERQGDRKPGLGAGAYASSHAPSLPATRARYQGARTQSRPSTYAHPLRRGARRTSRTAGRGALVACCRRQWRGNQGQTASGAGRDHLATDGGGAAALGLLPGAPVLDVLRTSLDQEGVPFEVSRHVHRGDPTGSLYELPVE